MRRKVNLFITLLLSVMLTVTMIPVCGFAASEDKSLDEIVQGLSANPKVNGNAYEDPFDFENGKPKGGSGDEATIQAEVEKNYPAEYDMRDKGIVTPVKLQSPFGTCWGFAAIAASEISILSDTGKQYDPDNPLDLSERHLAYFALGHIEDKSDSQYGEGHYCIPTKDNDTDKYPWLRMNEGAEGFFATTLFAAGIGPVTEKEVPYKNDDEYKDWVDFELSDNPTTYTCLLDSETEYRTEDAVPYQYSKLNPDSAEKCSWSVDESKKFMQAYELEESCMLPNPAGKNAEGKYEYNPEATKAWKDEIMNGHAVQIGFMADTSRPGQADPAKYINTDTWSHYTYDTDKCNHAVTIVGWNDNYKKENFLAAHPPKEDGAWLVKNSWGSDLNEFPNNGYNNWGITDEEGNHTGYFWLSYYDTSLTRPETLDFFTGESANKEDYYYVDGYDFMPIYSVGNMTSDKATRMSNIFTAEGDMKIRTVSCQTATPDSTVTYRIYKLGANQATPQGAKPVSTQTDKYGFGGYHRTNLSNPVVVRKGQRYAVEVEITTPEGKHEIQVSRAYNENGVGRSGDDGYTKGVVNEGESILYTGKEYVDWTSVLELLKNTDGGIYDYDNFAIKAYADPVTLKDPVLAKVKIKKVNRKKKALQVYWKQIGGVTGYQIAYKRTNSKSWKILNVPASKKNYKISKLKKRKKYNVKVRGYVNYYDKLVYGSWSKARKKKTR